MKTIDYEQGTAEWLLEHSIRCTASRFKDVMRGAKGKYLKSRETYMLNLASVRLTGRTKQLNGIAAIDHGKAYEDEARSAYEFITGNTVEQIGMVISDLDDMVGCSPDGLVCDDGGVEIKCFNTEKHIGILMNGMPAEVMPQVQGCMWVTDRKWWDFISYDPRMADKNIHIQRINRDDEYIKVMADDVLSFSAELNELIDKIME